ncbi:MAG: glycoside hydrolase family 9 protein, partial [Bacteroidota bacterium]
KTIQLAFILILLSTVLYGQTTSDFIVIDQFGYRPGSEKIAIIRNPEVGFDSDLSFQPGDTYAVVDEENEQVVFESGISIWNSGGIDDSSGDRCWWFDFSSVTTEGSYYVLDKEKNVRSFSFVIADNVYAEVLKQAVRTFYYQRAGYAKEEAYAGSAWADGASHLGSLQDPESRKYDQSTLSTTERDLQGGWYDAGDYNKYTQWTANYVIEFLQAYEENKEAWGDNYCLPYSGNGTPDIIDEVKWGMDYLLRLQEDDGSLWSVVSLDHAYPPSAASGQSLYGDVNTISAASGAAAFAYGAKVFGELGQTSYSNTLSDAATAAWDWSVANPNVVWRNNDAAFNSLGIGAGQQEVDDYGRLAFRVRAAVYLFELTGNAVYKDFVENNYEDIHLMLWNFAFPFEEANQEALLYYSNLEGVSSAVATDIQDTYRQAMQSDRNFAAITNQTDPYKSFLNDYVWGSNNTKARKGLMFTDFVKYDLDATQEADAMQAAEYYIHYIHGLNPLNFCYLSNMGAYGADKGVTSFYHTWFADGSPWDIAGQSQYGPPPGFVVGGANPTYDWDNFCNTTPNGNCDSDLRDRIINEPDQKSYYDFNTSWPMNSWELSENSCGYQLVYIRLLSKFVDTESVQGTTCGIENEGADNEDSSDEDSNDEDSNDEDSDNEDSNDEDSNDEDSDDNAIDEVPLNVATAINEEVSLYPNPSSAFIWSNTLKPVDIQIVDIEGKVRLEGSVSETSKLSIQHLTNGIYFARYLSGGTLINQKIVILKN